MPATTTTDRVNFGVGRLFVNAPGGQRTPYGQMTDISIDLTVDLKEIYGEGGFPIAVADGHRAISVTGKHYTLGQLFTEWNLRLDATDLGNLKTGEGRTLNAYVDGRRQGGDPAAIELTRHREIALVYGPANTRPEVPSSYAFPEGL